MNGFPEGAFVGALLMFVLLMVLNALFRPEREQFLCRRLDEVTAERDEAIYRAQEAERRLYDDGEWWKDR